MNIKRFILLLLLIAAASFPSFAQKLDNFHTISESPLRQNSTAAIKPLRASIEPLAVSVKIFSYPARSKASVCKSKFCSTVETLA